MTFGIIASGKSIKHLPEISNNFDECYIMNNCYKEIDHFKDIFKQKIIHHVVNSMPYEVLSEKYYNEYNIKDVYFMAPETERYKYEKSINILDGYGIVWHYLPQKFVKKYKNLSLYAIARACYYHKPDTVYIVGLDFYDGDYMFEKTSKYLKEKSKRIFMVESFNDIVSKNPEIQFEIYTVSKRVQEAKNLNIHMVK